MSDAPSLDRLLDALAPARDSSFATPPFDAAIAESLLGPSGAPRTPHRRLLERMNGAYLFERALHFFGACAEPPWHSLAAWNAPSLWRDAYAGQADGLVFFAEDAFGEQYAYSGVGGEVVVFEAELGRVRPAAPHFVAWLEALVAAPEAVLPLEYVRREADAGRPLAHGSQLFAYPPFCTLEAQEGVRVGQVDGVEAMRFRGALAVQLRGLPPGSRVKIDVTE